LADLRANALPVEEADELRRHIAECPVCKAKLAPVAGDVSSADTSTHLALTGPAPALPSGIPLDFLRPAVEEGELGRLGDYRVLRVLGSGGMGIVFEAEDLALRRRVALKVLRPDLTDEEFRKRFLREARAAASLSHEHIVTIYQVGEDNGVPFLAMEFLRGQSLEARLRRDGTLPLADALDIARQAAEGLVVAHDKGLIHRDVKPDNLWIESGDSGPVGRVKLLDFGLARPSHGPSDLTAPGQTVGTPGYMAPELVYGLQVDARADLYALGCVLYRMLTGKTPFADESANTLEMLRAAAAKDVSSEGLEASGLPAPVLAFLQELLSRDPAGRPPDARAAVVRLRALERDLPVPGARPAPPPPSGKAPPKQRTRFGVWAGALSVLLAALVGGVMLVQRLAFPAPAGSEENPNPPAVVAEGEEINVGLIYSLSGSLAYSEKPVRDATIQALREINDAGGVSVKGPGGTVKRRLRWVTEDGRSNEEDFARGAEKLLVKDRAVTLFGCWTSSGRKRVEEVCARHDRLLVYSVPDEGLEQSSHVFYLGGTPNQLMIPAVRWIYTDLRKRRFYLAGSEYVFSRAAHEILRHEVETLGGTVVGQAFRPLGSADFGAVAADIEHTNADVVLCTVDGLSNVAFAQALRARGLRPPAVPTVWFNVGENELRYMSDPKQLAGDYAPFCYFQSLDTPANRKFLERLRKAFEDPTVCVTDPMEASYCAVYLWKQAVEAAGTTDTGPLREAFRKQSLDAPEGTIRIDPPTQRAWRTPRVGRVNDKLDFDVVWAAPAPVAPEPYPPFRTRKQWEQFLEGLYKGWNGHWEEHAR
jgi:urea transport system substrate-binding protein